jgi:hypothetical protein
MAREHEEGKKLTVPSCSFDLDDEDGIPYTITTITMKIVHDYTGIDFRSLYSMDIFTYWQYLRDASIYLYNRTESGRDYLRKCWASEQTEPDRKTLRKLFGGGMNG